MRSVDFSYDANGCISHAVNVSSRTRATKNAVPIGPVINADGVGIGNCLRKKLRIPGLVNLHLATKSHGMELKAPKKHAVFAADSVK